MFIVSKQTKLKSKHVLTCKNSSPPKSSRIIFPKINEPINHCFGSENKFEQVRFFVKRAELICNLYVLNK